MIVLLQISCDSESELILKIGEYLVKLMHTKIVPIFGATLQLDW